MNRPPLFLGAAFLILVSAAPLAASPKPPEYASDLGPESIDVSGYSPEMQAGYARFQAKCTTCHSAARSLNAEHISSEEWSRYIKRMWLRPACCNSCPVISKADATLIRDFLTYDAQIRKTGAQRAAWIKHRRELLAEFKRKYPRKYQEQYPDHEQKGRHTP